MKGYITFAEARSTQIAALEAAVPRMIAEISAQRDRGELQGAGPVFLAMGASLAAAGTATWLLRERGIDAWRLGAGDTPVPLPDDGRQVIAVSQSGRSTETITAFDSVSRDRRYAVVNASPSPLGDAAHDGLSLGSVPDSYASTVGYNLTVLALGLIAEAWDGDLDEAGWAGFAARMGVVEALDVTAAATQFDGATWADFVGGGSSAGTAEAGALLFRETARIASSALSTRQYLHGAMESAGGGVHVLFGEEREERLAAMLAGAGNRVVLVTTDDVSIDGVAVIRIPSTGLVERTILETLVLQKLVLEVTAARDIEIEEFVFHNDDTKVDE